ncbi:MAG: hypothetical protein MRERV_3c092 [Mycoplasmataceae bacterium RV_VA103A]|nr:MAG: hypothetical protein MRERV_3c092 [Mycoplasmataceae bacterium RV_VA103A]
MNQTKFGVNILEHLKKQLKEIKDPNQRKDLEGLIKHLEEGKDYETYKGPAN